MKSKNIYDHESMYDFDSGNQSSIRCDVEFVFIFVVFVLILCSHAIC